MSIKTYIAENKLLVVVILLAAVLRFWNFFEIPLTHDEVSALNRTHFDNFADLIEYGVKADTHPPGVQVFTYLWVKTFGYEQWVVKLPFILMGLGSLLLAYSIFKKWSNETVALLIIALMATLQFTVMYSQIARPYISGMFLVLCMVYFWNGLVNRPEKNFWRNLILTGVFGAACGYNHHFSLLAAFMIGATGLFVIERKYLLKYLTLAALIILLYLPNLPIFLHQLERGGVGEWLGVPTPRFILDFFSYSLNHSIALMVVFISIVTVGIYNYKKGASIKWVMISGIWFFSVWIIGYYYSVYKNPVLQFSMLLFLFPFLFQAMLGWIPELGKKTQATLVLLVLFVGTTSLIFYRKHYEVFYANRYFQMKEDAAKYDKDKTCFVFATYPHFIEIDFPIDIDFPSEYLAWEENINTIKEYEEYIINCDKDQLFLGHVEQFPKELIAIANYYYPYVSNVDCTSGAASYLFSRGWEYQDLNYLELNVLDSPSINYHKDKFTIEGNYQDQEEWSIGSALDLHPEHPYDILSVHATIQLSSPTQDIMLVVEVPHPNGGEPFYWTGRASNEFVLRDDTTVNIVSAFSLDNIPKEAYQTDQPEIKTYLWNRSKEEFTVLEYQIHFMEGNRNKYCLWEDF